MGIRSWGAPLPHVRIPIFLFELRIRIFVVVRVDSQLTFVVKSMWRLTTMVDRSEWVKQRMLERGCTKQAAYAAYDRFVKTALESMPESVDSPVQGVATDVDMLTIRIDSLTRRLTEAEVRIGVLEREAQEPKAVVSRFVDGQAAKKQSSTKTEKSVRPDGLDSGVLPKMVARRV